jgi:hypothetical protein
MPTASLTWPPKDPDEKLDYAIEWADWLAETPTDSLQSSTWSASSPAGLVTSLPSINGTKTLLWLDDGVAGTTYYLENTVTTVQGRIAQRTVKVQVKAK